MRRRLKAKLAATLFALSFVLCVSGSAPQGARRTGSVRSVTIPVTVRLSGERERGEELRTLALVVHEDGEPQEILSTRSAADRSPLYLAVLVQDDLVSSVSNDIGSLASFVRALPEGSHVLVGYLRVGSLQVRQKFTPDLEAAARALRIPAGTPNAGPYNPFTQVRDAVKRFQSQPLGRRAVLVVSDGLDISRGADSSTPALSTDLQRAIGEAQKRSVAVYAIYAPTVSTANNLSLASNAQASLARLSDETGGRAFFQGTGAPVSFEPFLRQIRDRLNRQIALTYLSTHQSGGFHRIKIESSLPEAELNYPAGYPR
jgi:VWFA-related protein